MLRMSDQTQLAFALLRVGTSAVMTIHGVARAWLGIVGNFGVALEQWGFPAGLALAWVITIVEIVGGLSLAAGYLVRPLAIWFIVQLAMGVYLIHARVGWFVVGAGRNGSEFSALLILCFVVIILAAPAGYVLALPRHKARSVTTD
jgi:putative oxidoreductase